MKKRKFKGILTLFLFAIIFIACDKDKKEKDEQLTPQTLYQTQWKGTGYCEQWSTPKMGVSMQFITTEKGHVVWENYGGIDVTYKIEGKYISFNSNSLNLAGSPWVIKNYTKKHITLVQNEGSPNHDVATIELDRID